MLIALRKKMRAYESAITSEMPAPRMAIGAISRDEPQPKLESATRVSPGATCAAGPVTRPYYSNFGATLNAIAAPGGSSWLSCRQNAGSSSGAELPPDAGLPITKKRIAPIAVPPTPTSD